MIHLTMKTETTFLSAVSDSGELHRDSFVYFADGNFLYHLENRSIFSE
jgi:hypothetical protein